MGGPDERQMRRSARVIVIDDAGRVLLFRVDDPHDDKPPCWITPGGEVEAGEELAAAAVRELAEETGMVLPPDTIGEPVAVCRGDWIFRGVPLFSEDWYFASRAATFEPDPSGWTTIEHEVYDGWRWWTADELDATRETVFPAGLGPLVRTLLRGGGHPEPLELVWTDG